MDTALRDKILGSLAGSAIGDAMGAATELLTEGEIIRRFGKPVDSFEVPPPGNPYAGGRDAGQLTDDSSLTLGLCRAYLENQGVMTVEAVVQTILRWKASIFPVLRVLRPRRPYGGCAPGRTLSWWAGMERSAWAALPTARP